MKAPHVQGRCGVRGDLRGSKILRFPDRPLKRCTDSRAIVRSLALSTALCTDCMTLRALSRPCAIFIWRCAR